MFHLYNLELLFGGPLTNLIDMQRNLQKKNIKNCSAFGSFNYVRILGSVSNGKLYYINVKNVCIIFDSVYLISRNRWYDLYL